MKVSWPLSSLRVTLTVPLPMEILNYNEVALRVRASPKHTHTYVRLFTLGNRHTLRTEETGQYRGA